MKFLYRLTEEGGTWTARAIEIEACGTGTTAAEAVLELRGALEEALGRRGRATEVELVPIPAPIHAVPSRRAAAKATWRRTACIGRASRRPSTRWT